MKAVIEFKYIVKIQNLLIKEYELLDDDDARGAGPVRRFIQKYLDLITDNEEYQREIEECIYRGMWCQYDLTYKPINDLLRKHGYEITGEKE